MNLTDKVKSKLRDTALKIIKSIEAEVKMNLTDKAKFELRDTALKN